jgi:hypothetical protein
LAARQRSNLPGPRLRYCTCGSSEPDPPQGAMLRDGELPRRPRSPRGRPSHAVGEFPEPSWRNCPPHPLRGDLLGDAISHPVRAAFSALRSPTDEDKATSWPMPTALRCFAPGTAMMEATQARAGNRSRPRRRPLFDWPAIRRVLGGAVVNTMVQHPAPAASHPSFSDSIYPRRQLHPLGSLRRDVFE